MLYGDLISPYVGRTCPRRRLSPFPGLGGPPRPLQPLGFPQASQTPWFIRGARCSRLRKPVTHSLESQKH